MDTYMQYPACMASPQTSCHHQESYRRTAPQARRERAAAAAASRQREARARGCVAQPRGDTAGIISEEAVAEPQIATRHGAGRR